LTDDHDIAEFVRAYLPSVWALELLLRLKAEPTRVWTENQLVRELRASTNLVDENLLRFERQGLVLKESKGWRYAPANPSLDGSVGNLAQLYRDRPMYTIGLIARADPLHSLADAFRIRKDET
jgi:hypothetical protein